MNTTTKIESITIIGRRWFQRGPGNTYHSVEIIVNGKTVHNIDFAYGYGSMYAQNAGEWLEKNGYIDGYKFPLSIYCRENGIDLIDRVVDVERKKVL